MAVLRPQQPRAALGDGGQELAEGLRAGERLAELGQVLELGDAPPHLLVEAGVLDRARHERGARHEHVDLSLGELARRPSVARDDADDVPVLADDRHADERLEELLLELRDVLRPRVLEESLADPGRLLPLRRPPGEALAALEHDLADLLGVGLGRRRQDEAVLALHEVHEARVDGGGVREQPDDRVQHLVQVERRADRRDDGVEKPALAGMRCRWAADGRMVGRNAQNFPRYSARGPT